MGTAARRAAWAFAVLAGTAGIAWLLAPPPRPLAPPLAPATPQPAASPPRAVTEPEGGTAITHGDPGKLFADAVRRASEPPPPVKGIVEARSFQEAFAAMQKAERERAQAQSPGLAASPFVRP